MLPLSVFGRGPEGWEGRPFPCWWTRRGVDCGAEAWAVVDAILAKKNLGTNRRMARHTVALGPGFTAGVDVDAVIETKRGHQLGRIIWQGTAIANTGIPGLIAGYGRERVIHSQQAGFVYGLVHIGDKVKKGQPMAVLTEELIPFGMAVTECMGTPILASLTGFVRGLIRDGYQVPQGFKIADIDRGMMNGRIALRFPTRPAASAAPS